MHIQIVLIIHMRSPCYTEQLPVRVKVERGEKTTL